jgi:hypothetical protein
MSGQQRRYISYLLRLWQQEDDGLVWRLSLESPHSGKRRGFVSLGELCAFLETEMNRTEPREDSTN